MTGLLSCFHIVSDTAERRAAFCVVFAAICRTTLRANGTLPIVHVVKFASDVKNDVITSLNKLFLQLVFGHPVTHSIQVKVAGISLSSLYTAV